MVFIGLGEALLLSFKVFLVFVWKSQIVQGYAISGTEQAFGFNLIFFAVKSFLDQGPGRPLKVQSHEHERHKDKADKTKVEHSNLIVSDLESIECIEDSVIDRVELN